MKNEIKKLKHTTESFFKIIKNIRNTVYKLNISNFRIHNVFNASLLNKTDESVSLTKTFKIKARKKEYEVRKILKERKNRRKKEILISWKDFESENDQWESKQNVKYAKKAITKFRKKVLKKEIMLRVKQSNRTVRL